MKHYMLSFIDSPYHLSLLYHHLSTHPMCRYLIHHNLLDTDQNHCYSMLKAKIHTTAMEQNTDK